MYILSRVNTNVSVRLIFNLYGDTSQSMISLVWKTIKYLGEPFLASNFEINRVWILTDLKVFRFGFINKFLCDVNHYDIFLY